MILKKLFLFSIISLINIYGYCQSPRGEFNFNSKWKLHVGDVNDAEKPDFNDSNWKQVTLPYAFNQDEAFSRSIEKLSTDIVWYRKEFKLPENSANKKVFIEFEGIRQGGEIYLNGKKIGLHENGAMAFGLDLTDYILLDQTNIIALRVDNSWGYREKETNENFRWNDKNFNANYGGIPKNVTLHVTNKLYQTLPLFSNLETTGVYVYASDINIPGKSATINIESEVRNENPQAKSVTLLTEVYDLDGQKVAEFAGDETLIPANETRKLFLKEYLDDLHFWSWGYGYLYTVKTTLIENDQVIDEVDIRTGFRKTAFKDGKIFLNDRVIQMKGYAQRTSNEWPAVGMSVPAWLSDFSNRLMVESNANLVRWMHITPWKQDVESCDRVGLIQAMPAGDSEGDSRGRNWEQRVELMRDAIIYNRNNPSIIFYESGNDAISEEHMHEMKSIRNTYDPHGGRAIGSREMLDSQEAEYGGEMLYINKSADIPMWATEYSRDEGQRRYWDQYSPPYHKEGEGPLYKGEKATSYNHNQDQHAIENIVRWFDYFEARPGTGHRVSSGGVNIIFSDSNTHHRGEEEYRASGEVDPMRIPKDGYFAHQVMWDGWVDVENYRTHIIGHWSYEKELTKDIYVVSSGEKVELFLNDRTLGLGDRTNHFLFTFEDVKFEEGTLKAVSYDEAGNKLSEDTLVTAGAPDAIRLGLRKSPTGFKANGADLVLIDVEVVDKNGRRCPISNNEIKFSLRGEGEWLGGIAAGKNNRVLDTQLPVVNGINRVLVRSTETPGGVTLRATAKGLKNDNIEFQSEEFSEENGLSTSMPGDGLPSNLSRGATPENSSYSMKRNTVFVRNATSGANQDEVYLSFDDNERSEWSNDGFLTNGWISYELAKPAKVDQCVIKLSDWRRKQYRVRILADGQEVFKGVTPQSLGYVTLDLKPVLARNIRIELFGENTRDDAFSDIVEVDPINDINTNDKKEEKEKGNLEIVEVEFYQSISPSKEN